jgi:hypothetical protein
MIYEEAIMANTVALPAPIPPAVPVSSPAQRVRTAAAKPPAKPPNPVLTLRASMQSVVSYDQGQEQAQYLGWISEMLAGARIGFRYESDLRASYSQFRSDIDKSAIELMKGINQVRSEGLVVKEMPVQEVTNSIGEISELAFDGIGDIVEGVVDALPVLGLATNLIKTIGLTLANIWAIKKLLDAEQQMEAAAYILQKESWLGALEYRRYKGKIDSLDLAAAAVKLGTQLIPVPGVASALNAATTATKALIKLFFLLDIEKRRLDFNKKLVGSTINLNYADLESHPIARLMIPHYPEIDALCLLGVLPPNWQVLQLTSGMQKLAKQLSTNEEHRWLFNAFWGSDPSYTTLEDFPEVWRPQVQQLQKLFEETNSQLFDMPYVLRNKDSVIVYDAPPQGKIQFMKYLWRSGRERVLNTGKALGSSFLSYIEAEAKLLLPAPTPPARPVVTTEPITLLAPDPRNAPLYLEDVDDED